LDLGAFLLAVSAFLLAISPLADLPELARQLLHFPCEVGQLPCDARYVLFGGHALLSDSTGRKLLKEEGSLSWRWGDLALEVEPMQESSIHTGSRNRLRKWAEEIGWFEEGHEFGTLVKYRETADRWPERNRFPSVSFSAHYELRSIPFHAPRQVTVLCRSPLKARDVAADVLGQQGLRRAGAQAFVPGKLAASSRLCFIGSGAVLHPPFCPS